MEQSEPTDAELVDRTRSGHRESYGLLYDRYAPVVRAVFRSIGFPWTVVEDLTQECFLRSYRKLWTLHQPEKFGPWICGLARNVAREKRRSIARDRHEFVNNADLRPSETSDFTADVQTAEDLRLLQTHLEQLPEEERLAIHAFFLAEQSAPEVAEAMNLSRSGFYALLKRAIGRLGEMHEQISSGKDKS